MENLLEEWGLKEFIDKFKEQEITLDCIQELRNPEILKELIPTIGKRIIFLQKLEEYNIRNSTYNTSLEPSLVPSEISTIEENILNGTIIAPTDQDFVFTFSDEIPTTSTSNISAISQEDFEIPAKKLRSQSTYVNNFNLNSFLNSSAVGRALLAWYELKGGLDSTRQSYLVDLISSDFINNGFTHLSNSDFKELSKKIVETFPLEVSEAYFLPPVKKRDSIDKKSGVAKGKLVDKWKNKLTFLREAGILPARSRSPLNSENDLKIIDGKDNQSIEWLRQNREPLEEVYRHWENCFTIRRQKFITCSNLDTCYELFPIFNESVCLSLIERDFSKIFSNKTNNYIQFEEVFMKLAKLRASSISSGSDKIFLDLIATPSIQEDYKHYLMVLLLASLLPNKSRHVYGRSRKHYKPTTADSRDGLILKVDLPGDIENKIKAKVEKLTALELPVQPFIVVVGTGAAIQKNYVYINKQLYPVGTVLKGMDACFKAFHVFHIRYQIESEYVWFFLQLALYDLKSKWDVTLPNIIDISNKIKTLK